MGWLNDTVNDVTDAAKNALGFGNSGSVLTIETMTEEPYNPAGSNWYKALPYGFKFTTREGDQWTCYLPISPENIAITTHFGTNIIPTLYGTVEEHSEQRYYDILISGSTGFAPKYVSPFSSTTPVDKNGDPFKTGRTSYKDDKSGVGLDPNLAGGFFQKSIGALNKGLNTINKMAENFTGVQVQSGITVETSGYIAFHNLYRFLLAYKKDAAGLTSTIDRETHPLTFLNYKDGQKYDCAITKFDLRRSASTPQLYNYTIAFRAYNLKDLNAIKDDKTGSMAKRLEDLGLKGVGGSAFQKMKQTSNGAKGLIGSISGGLNVLGG